MASVFRFLAQFADVSWSATRLEAVTISSLASASMHAVSVKALVALLHLGTPIRFDSLVTLGRGPGSAWRFVTRCSTRSETSSGPVGGRRTLCLLRAPPSGRPPAPSHVPLGHRR